MKLKESIIYFAFGMILALTAFLFFLPSIQREQLKTRRAEAQAIYERRLADHAYRAEVIAEKARWEKLETEIVYVPAATEEIITDPVYEDPRIPDEVEEAARIYGEMYSISPELLETMAWKESRFHEGVVSKGCVGLMQVAPRWHRSRMARLGVSEAELYTVSGNMAVAADYLAELFEENNDELWVLMKYNGDGRADSVLNGGRASSYAQTITEKAAALTTAHENNESLDWLEK